MFKQIETDDAVVVSNGVFKPAKVFEYNGALFVAASGGFVRVKEDGSTSHPNIRVHTLMREDPIWRDGFGRLCVAPGAGRTELRIAHEGEFRAVLPPPEETKAISKG